MNRRIVFLSTKNKPDAKKDYLSVYQKRGVEDRKGVQLAQTHKKIQFVENKICENVSSKQSLGVYFKESSIKVALAVFLVSQKIIGQI